MLFQLLYCHLLIHSEIYIYMLDTYRRNEQQTQEDFFNKIYISRFICKGTKRLLKGCVWEGPGDRTETVIFWPRCYDRQRCVFLVLLMLNRSPGVHSVGCWLSLLHLISIFSGPQFIRASSPFGLVWFPYHISLQLAATRTQLPLDSNSTELYNRSTPTRSLKSNA